MTKGKKGENQNVKTLAAEAEAELEKFPGEHRLKMKGECEDKDGQLTAVLILDTDPEGIIGLDSLLDNPAKFDVNAGDLVFDEGKLERYLALMLNVDISSEENRKAIGWQALGRAKEKAKSFFTLAAASLLPETLGLDG